MNFLQSNIINDPTTNLKYFIIESELPKETLRDVINRRKSERQPFSPQEIAKISTDLFEGLFYMHQINITHQNIKPENIFYISSVDSYVYGNFFLSEKIEAKDLKPRGN
jgi:serine/threonine protein kinase